MPHRFKHWNALISLNRQVLPTSIPKGTLPRSCAVSHALSALAPALRDALAALRARHPGSTLELVGIELYDRAHHADRLSGAQLIRMLAYHHIASDGIAEYVFATDPSVFQDTLHS